MRKKVQSLLPNDNSSDNNNISSDSKDKSEPLAGNPNILCLSGPLTGTRTTTLATFPVASSPEELFEQIQHAFENDWFREMEIWESLLAGINRFRMNRIPDFARKRKPFLHKMQGYFESKESSTGGAIDQIHSVFVKSVLLLCRCGLADDIKTTAQTIQFLIGDMKYKVSSFMNTASLKMLPLNLFYQLCWATCQRLAEGKTIQLLSTPTHRNGWIDPVVLADRILSDGFHPDHHDLWDKVLCLYRLAPDGRDEAANKLTGFIPADPYIITLQKILTGDPQTDRQLPEYFQTAHRFDQAMRSGEYQLDCVVEKQVNRWCSREKSPWFGLKVKEETPSVSLLELISSTGPDPLLYPLSLFKLDYRSDTYPVSHQWDLNLVPAFREKAYIDGINQGRYFPVENSRFNEADVLLRPLLNANEPFTPAAERLAVMVLVAKHSDESLLATDVLIAGLKTGRLDAPSLSEAFEFWIRNDLTKKNRWFPCLQTIGDSSPVCCQAVLVVLEKIISLLTPREAASGKKLLKRWRQE